MYLSCYYRPAFHCIHRAFDTLLKEGTHFLKSALLNCQSGKPKGRLLITGTTGDVGLACGKSSLAKLLAKSVTGYPIFARLELVECTSMRGKCIFDTETSAHKQKVYLYKEY